MKLGASRTVVDLWVGRCSLLLTGLGRVWSGPVGWEMLPPLDRVREGVEGGYDSQLGIRGS